MSNYESYRARSSDGAFITLTHRSAQDYFVEIAEDDGTTNDAIITFDPKSEDFNLEYPSPEKFIEAMTALNLTQIFLLLDIDPND